MAGTRPEFYVRSAEAPDSVRARLFEREDFFAAGLDRARCVATISFTPTPHHQVLLGEPERALPAGDYIVALGCASHPDWVALSGVLLRESEDVWPQVFERLDARCRAAMSAPAGIPGSGLLSRLRRRPLFSITTTVYNTDPWFLRELCDCLAAQSCPDFEWILLDNGSTAEGTRAEMQRIAAGDPRIRFFRVEENLHIIGGNRYTLKRARGRYIIPVDSDDIVYPYALEIIRDYARNNRYPDLLFSDEHKISVMRTPREYLWRPSWSRLSALSTCPASHLMAFDRRAALRVKAYTGDYARGSHDWDTALRLEERNPRVVHIPEVLYGWRMHMSSAAMNEGSKQYLLDSQIAVVRESIVRRGLGPHFEVEGSGKALGYYHLRSRRIRRPPVLVDVVLPEVQEGADQRLAHNLSMIEYPNCYVRVHLRVPDADPRVLSRALTFGPRQARACEFAPYHEESELLARLCNPSPAGAPPAPEYQAILYNGISVTDSEWLWDAVATFDLDPEIGVVGGRIVDERGGALHVGYVAGLGGFFGCPRPRESPDVIYGAIGRIRRSVSAVYGSFTMIRSDVFPRVGPLRGFDSGHGAYGVEFCARARQAGFRIAFTPRMAGTASIPVLPLVPDSVLGAEMLSQYGPSLLNDPYYSSLCSREPHAYGQPRMLDGGAPPASARASLASVV
jgi:GT2 family glycosyltransferase